MFYAPSYIASRERAFVNLAIFSSIRCDYTVILVLHRATHSDFGQTNYVTLSLPLSMFREFVQISEC